MKISLKKIIKEEIEKPWYVQQHETHKKESLEIAYEYYLSVFENADYNEFTYGSIAWGCNGYTLSYRKLT